MSSLSDRHRTRLSFSGGSMGGTFSDGDCLFVQKIPFDALQPGDVVAYRGDEKAVAHRIVGRSAGGWMTQGDGNRGADRHPLSADRLIGKVIEFERNGIRHPVVNGTAGLRRARWLHNRARWSRALFFCAAPLYRLLRSSRVARVLWRPAFMRLRVAGCEGDCLKFIHRGRTAACWFPGEERWTCRKPYDLVLDAPGDGGQ